MKIMFWVSLMWVTYAYGGYMALLAVVTAFKKNAPADESAEPAVTMIIAAYNEEKAIERKIQNCFELDYPKEKLEILIVSDASTDRTDEIVNKYASDGIKLLRVKERAGKTGAQNYAVASAAGDMLVFSDATTVYKKDAIRKLVRNFSNKKVGIVAGEEIFRKKVGSKIYNEVSFSWKYERLLRRFESRFNTLIGVSGCIFAIRKELYKKLDENLIEDFALPLLVAEKGYKVHLEQEAVAYEESVSDPRDEFTRKVRIVRGGITVLFSLKRLLNPIKNPKLAFQLVSHKVFRWFTPVFMILLFISNMFLLGENGILNLFFIFQVAGYTLAGIGYSTRRNAKRSGIVKIPFYFCLVNAAAIVGIIKFIQGDRKVVWETVR